MTEPNGSALYKSDPDEPGIGAGTTLQTAQPGPQEPPASRGRTTIADGVVEKIAGIAAREVPGINALGGGFTRSMGAVRDRVPGGHASAGRGVKVEVGEKQTAIDLQVVVAYGVSIRAAMIATTTGAVSPKITARAAAPVAHARANSARLELRSVAAAASPDRTWPSSRGPSSARSMTRMAADTRRMLIDEGVAGAHEMPACGPWSTSMTVTQDGTRVLLAPRPSLRRPTAVTVMSVD